MFAVANTPQKNGEAARSLHGCRNGPVASPKLPACQFHVFLGRHTRQRPWMKAKPVFKRNSELLHASEPLQFRLQNRLKVCWLAFCLRFWHCIISFAACVFCTATSCIWCLNCFCVCEKQASMQNKDVKQAPDAKIIQKRNNAQQMSDAKNNAKFLRKRHAPNEQQVQVGNTTQTQTPKDANPESKETHKCQTHTHTQTRNAKTHKTKF